VQSEKPATVSIDHQTPLAMTNIAGTHYWYKLLTLRLGTTHNYNYFAEGKSLGTYDVAGYNPDSYPQPGVPHGQLSEMKTHPSKIYPGMSANYWVYVNPGADLTNGAPLMVWQDGETIVGTQDLLRLRMQIVSDNLVHKKAIPPMVHVSDLTRERRRGHWHTHAQHTVRYGVGSLWQISDAGDSARSREDL
jgi:hypothetical protein